MLKRVRQTRKALDDNTESFRALRNSEYWQFLPEKTKANILILIGENRPSESKQWMWSNNNKVLN
jgi:hypothetical protein